MGQDGSSEVDLEWICLEVQWLLNYSICKVCKELIVFVGMPMWPWWANDHDVAHLQSRTVPINLIWSESAQWLLSFAIHKVPRAFIMSVGTPMWPRSANDWDVAHRKAKIVPMNFIWSNYWVMASAKIRPDRWMHELRNKWTETKNLVSIVKSLWATEVGWHHGSCNHWFR